MTCADKNMIEPRYPSPSPAGGARLALHQLGSAIMLACLLWVALHAAPLHAAALEGAVATRQVDFVTSDPVPEFSLHDIWRQYRWLAIASLAVGGLILLLGFWVLVKTRKLIASHNIEVQQKQQLEESEQRYRFLFSNNPLPMFILAEETFGFIEVNERAIEYYGFTREEFGRMTLHDLRAVEGVTELERAISSSPRGKVLTEARQKKKGGAVVNVAINAMPMQYGKTPAWIVLVQDITGRRALQKKITEQLAFIEAVVNAEVNGLSVCYGIDEAPYARFTVWNPSMEALTGYRMEEINRLGWYQTAYPDSEMQEQARQRMERMRAGDHLRGEEWTITCKDGSHRVVQVHTVTVAEDQRGKHTLAVMQDVTERKRVQDALVKLSLAVEQSPTSIVITDLDANIEYANEAFVNTTGYSLAEAIGQNPRLLQSGKTPKATYDEMWCKLTRGEVWQGELINRRKDGSEYIELALISPVCQPDGRVTHYLAVKENITERKQYEEELKRSNAELEQFSYAVSHDMRQPLRMISSYLQLIEKSLAGQLDSEKRGYFGFAIDGAKRIDQMLVALLEYSRIGRMGEPSTWIDSRATLDEALQFLQPAIVEAQARLDISGDWPRIFASHDEILRLLQNLIGNAIKYRAAGRRPEITVSGEVVKNEWRLCVTDNGIGIIPDQIKRLFQVFQRLQSREAYEGTGIGLALCRKIAEHHKGHIWAESAGEGQGSRFCVVLPMPSERTLFTNGTTA